MLLFAFEQTRNRETNVLKKFQTSKVIYTLFALFTSTINAEKWDKQFTITVNKIAKLNKLYLEFAWRFEFNWNDVTEYKSRFG